MNGPQWRWKIEEAVDRLRSHYDHIGRKTGAPFLALVYPPQAEKVVLSEWHTQVEALRPGVDICHVDALDVTQQVLADMGVEAVVETLQAPMPGSNPRSELGDLWLSAC